LSPVRAISACEAVRLAESCRRRMRDPHPAANITALSITKCFSHFLSTLAANARRSDSPHYQGCILGGHGFGSVIRAWPWSCNGMVDLISGPLRVRRVPAVAVVGNRLSPAGLNVSQSEQIVHWGTKPGSFRSAALSSCRRGISVSCRNLNTASPASASALFSSV
jgi:hypothetical protein